MCMLLRNGPPGTTVLWRWVQPAILENDQVKDFSADETVPPGEGRRAETDLRIHERLFHHQIMTAWASHDEVGFCRTPTHVSPFEPTTRSLPNATGVARGTAEVLAWADDALPVGAGMCHRGPRLQPDIAPSRDQEGRLVSAWSASFAKEFPARGELTTRRRRGAQKAHLDFRFRHFTRYGAESGNGNLPVHCVAAVHLLLL